MKKILINKAKCKVCGDVIVSKHRHDFVQCNCGEISVDGGQEYLRRGARNVENFIELSEFEEFDSDLNKEWLW